MFPQNWCSFFHLGWFWRVFVAPLSSPFSHSEWNLQHLASVECNLICVIRVMNGRNAERHNRNSGHDAYLDWYFQLVIAFHGRPLPPRSPNGRLPTLARKGRDSGFYFCQNEGGCTGWLVFTPPLENTSHFLRACKDSSFPPISFDYKKPANPTDEVHTNSIWPLFWSSLQFFYSVLTCLTRTRSVVTWLFFSWMKHLHWKLLCIATVLKGRRLELWQSHIVHETHLIKMHIFLSLLFFTRLSRQWKRDH